MTTVEVSTEHLFRLAELAGCLDNSAASATYEILISNPSQEVRLKARVKLAKLETKQGHFEQAAALLQRVLEFRPEATSIRHELADVLNKVAMKKRARWDREVKIKGGGETKLMTA